MKDEINVLKERYNGMIQRCCNPKSSDYDNYGGRGISVCDDWKTSALNFITWAVDNGFKKDLQLNRIDNDGDYCPENCEFTTAKENCNNRRSNRHIDIGGRTLTMAQAAEEYEIPYELLKSRLNAGWRTEDALTRDPYENPNSTSPYLGVSKIGDNKFRAYIHFTDGLIQKSIHVGVFDNQFLAAFERNKWAVELHGSKAKLNLPPQSELDESYTGLTDLTEYSSVSGDFYNFI